jgi:hypothetical protein
MPFSYTVVSTISRSNSAGLMAWDVTVVSMVALSSSSTPASDGGAKAPDLGGITWQARLVERHAAEVLPHDVLGPALHQFLVAELEGVLQVQQAGHPAQGKAVTASGGNARTSDRRTGLASRLVRHAEQALVSFDCMKVNLQLLASNEDTAAFYKSLGCAVEPRISMGKRLHENVPSSA